MAWPKARGLPLYLQQRYEFYALPILGATWLCVCDRGSEVVTPGQIAKHLEAIQTVWQQGVPIYCVEQMTALQRQRLIQQRVQFVVPGSQMYLPLLGLDLREKFAAQQRSQTTLSPATQAAFLLALLQGEIRLTAEWVKEHLHYSPMTANRAITEMAELELGVTHKEGRTRILTLHTPLREIWTKALPHLRSPVARVTHVTCDIPTSLYGVLAGESALASYSNLAEPANKTYARYIGNKPDKAQALADGDTVLQYWMYDSELLTGEGRLADPLSVFLTLRESPDERVQLALQEMLEKLPWYQA